jgi:hypothetical protein
MMSFEQRTFAQQQTTIKFFLTGSHTCKTRKKRNAEARLCSRKIHQVFNHENNVNPSIDGYFQPFLPEDARQCLGL